MRTGYTASSLRPRAIFQNGTRCIPLKVARLRYGRTVAICFMGVIDPGAAMVTAGQAVAYGTYQAEEREACAARRGVWASTFEHPATWRARHPR